MSPPLAKRQHARAATDSFGRLGRSTDGLDEVRGHGEGLLVRAAASVLEEARRTYEDLQAQGAADEGLQARRDVSVLKERRADEHLQAQGAARVSEECRSEDSRAAPGMKRAHLHSRSTSRWRGGS